MLCILTQVGLQSSSYPTNLRRTEEIKEVRAKISRLEDAIKHFEGEVFGKAQEAEIELDTTLEDSDSLAVILYDGSIVRCWPQPFSRRPWADLYRTVDNNYVVKLLKDPEPWREQALQAIVERLNPAQSVSHCRSLLCWPDGVIKSPRIGVRIPRASAEMRALDWFILPKARSVLPPEHRGDWRGHVEISLKIARAVRCLHMSGVHHSDLSPRNILVDPRDGSAVLIDLDEVAVPGVIPPAVLGTPRYMAPEIVAGQTLPSVWTDLHALAVLIYQTLLFRHPLLGPKIHADDPDENEKLMLGQQALYIEHPTDSSNRLPGLMSCAVLGPEMQRLFERAFVDGLHHPQSRPTAAEWETVLSRMQEKIVVCDNPECEHKHFVHTDFVEERCPWCSPPAAESDKWDVAQSRRLPIYLLLDISSQVFVQAENQIVSLLYNELMNDPNAINMVYLGIITFGGQAKMLTPLTELTLFSPPVLHNAEGARVTGAALRLLSESLDRDILRGTPERKGDYKPIAFLVTDGMPTDTDVWEHETQALKNRTTNKVGNTIVLIPRDRVKELEHVMKQLSEVILIVDDITPDQISQFFKWVSESVSTASVSVQAAGAGEVQAELPPPPPGIQVAL